MPRVILVDDEAPARRYLRRLLEAHSDVEVVGEAATQEHAAQLIGQLQPDVLFLDIELTEGTGFDLLGRLATVPAVVFVTAHADHALRAYDVAAVDYLLKPVDAQRLNATLGRLRRLGNPGAQEAHLVVRSRHGVRQIKVQSLSALLAQGDYVRLCCVDGTSELIHATLTRLRPQLPSPPFFQASRSIIVNLNQVARIGGGAEKQVEFIHRAAPIALGLTAYERLRRELARRDRGPKEVSGDHC
jgi:two-component system LytT family response regulator